MSLSTTVHDLKTLVLSYHPAVVIRTVEEERVERLLRAVARDLRMPLFEWSLTRGLARLDVTQPVYGTTDPTGVLRHLGTLAVEMLVYLKDFGVHLEHPAVQRAFRDVTDRFTRTRSTLVLSGDPVELPAAVSHLAVHLDLQLPDEDELRGVIRAVLTSVQAKRPVEVALTPDEMGHLLRALTGLTLNQARQALAFAVLEDGRLSSDDIQRIVDRKAQLIHDEGLLEYFPVQDNRFEIGGFGRLKAWLDRSRVGFGREARALNLSPPKGVLLVGVQGCGKSLAAKFIARAWQMPLLKLDAGRLYDKFVGESEKNFRHATALAESMAPAVLWIDEIEKSFAASGGVDADGGLSRRLLGAFLTWLQERRADVFVVATANDLDAVPPELLRKGRFDEIFFVDLPDDGEREAIFRIHLGLRKQVPSRLDLGAVVAATAGFSGAEIEQAVIGALYRALHVRQPLSTELLLEEIRGTVPLSVSRREQIEGLRLTARGRFVPVRE
jgi:hypothetical protein